METLLNCFRGFTSFGAQTHSLLLHQHQFKPFELYEPNSVDALIRGLLMQPAQKMDRAFTDEVPNELMILIQLISGTVQYLKLSFCSRLRIDSSKAPMKRDSI